MSDETILLPENASLPDNTALSKSTMVPTDHQPTSFKAVTGNTTTANAMGADRGGIITARGTGDGLVLRLDARVAPASLKEALVEFVIARKGFLSGQAVALEWVGSKPEPGFVDEISLLLKEEFDLEVRASNVRHLGVPAREVGNRAPDSAVLGRAADRDKGEKPLSLFDGVEMLNIDESMSLGDPGKTDPLKANVFDNNWDEADARFLQITLRSGQKIETEHSLVIMGDVNSGAEVIAGGDIVVLGSLRGVAHAGAYDETGGGRSIFALDLQPTQLRIGLVISRGTGDRTKTDRSGPEQPGGAEIARVDGNMIVVEPYLVRGSKGSPPAWTRFGFGKKK